jgi:ribosomal protein S21
MKITNIFKKKSRGKNFFELPSEEKKRIIKKAVKEANKMQLELVKEYSSKYTTA